MQRNAQADLVLEGGGMKGIGLGGAIDGRTPRHGDRRQRPDLSRSALRAAADDRCRHERGGIVEFDATAEQRAEVVANGKAAAQRFLAGWDWDAFRRECPPLPAGRLS